MGRSFGARIILLTVGVSGVVLAAFALSAGLHVYRTGLRAIDRDLTERTAPVLLMPHPPEHWAWIAGGLDMSFRGEGGSGCAVLVQGPKAQPLHRSANWPEQLKIGREPLPGPPRPVPPTPPPASPPRPEGPRPGPMPKGDPGPGAPAWSPLPISPPEFATRRAGGTTWRLCTMANSEAVLTVGVNLARFEAEMARVRTAFLAGMPAALLGIALGSWLVSRRALRSVESLAQAAEGVTASTLDQRIPDAGAETEFARLIRVFNHMLDRLERSFRQAMRFSADAAHELKTPLTILQGEIEQALQEAPPGSPQQQTLNDLLEEVQRLKSIVRKLLLLAQADAGQLRLAPEAVDLSQAVVALCDDTEALASHLSVRRDIVPDIQVQADPDLLAQVLQNLSTNAVKYNQEGGWIEFRLRPASRSVALTVSNSGPEIPAGDHDRVFERFYRADPARSRTRADGTGLGLSLSREIARAHGGELVLEQSRDGMTSFVLRLPLGG